MNRTSIPYEWKPADAITAVRLNESQGRGVFEITVQQGTPLTLGRLGNKLVIGMRPQASGGAGREAKGTEQGQVHQMVTNNVDGWDFPVSHN